VFRPKENGKRRLNSNKITIIFGVLIVVLLCLWGGYTLVFQPGAVRISVIEKTSSESSRAGFVIVVLTMKIVTTSRNSFSFSADKFELKTDSGSFHYSSAVPNDVPTSMSGMDYRTFDIGFEIPSNDTPNQVILHWGLVAVATAPV
jgi:bacteriorhodopsin